MREEPESKDIVEESNGDVETTGAQLATECMKAVAQLGIKIETFLANQRKLARRLHELEKKDNPEYNQIQPVEDDGFPAPARKRILDKSISGNNEVNLEHQLVHEGMMNSIFDDIKRLSERVDLVENRFPDLTTGIGVNDRTLEVLSKKVIMLEGNQNKNNTTISTLVEGFNYLRGVVNKILKAETVLKTQPEKKEKLESLGVFEVYPEVGESKWFCRWEDGHFIFHGLGNQDAYLILRVKDDWFIHNLQCVQRTGQKVKKKKEQNNNPPPIVDPPRSKTKKDFA
jgi:hypothetical protein